MKTIHAHWDDISLGVKSFEVGLNCDDRVCDFLREEKRLIEVERAEYICVKTPAGVQDHLFGLPAAGYSFLETSIELVLHKKNYRSPPLVDRIAKESSVNPLKEPDDLQRVYNEIQKGIFSVDRFSLDPGFSQQLGNQRCVNWIGDLIKDGNPLLEVSVKGVPSGFFILQPVDDKVVKGVLTGIYQQTAGLGMFVMKQLKEYVWSRGYTTYLAQVSSNNLKALRANMIFGSEIENLNYTYIKHVQRGDLR